MRSSRKEGERGDEEEWREKKGKGVRRKSGGTKGVRRREWREEKGVK